MPDPFITKSVADAEGNAGIEISDPTTGVRAKVNADGQLSVDVGGLNINPGDINIGAVELKDGVTDDRATVKTDGTDIALTVRQNNQPLPTGAATQATLTEIAGDTDNLTGIKAGTDKIIVAPATEAKQDTTNTSLASLDAKTPAKGSANMAGSTPVTLATDDEVAADIDGIESNTGRIPTQGSSTLSTSLPTNETSATLYDGSQATSTSPAALNGGTPQAIREVLITNLDTVIGMLVGKCYLSEHPIESGRPRF